MDADKLTNILSETRRFFERTASVLEEDDSNFVPSEGMYSVASQVYHVAHVVDWALAGAFGDGWDMDFRRHDEEVRQVTSLTEARAALARAFENAEVVIRSRSEEELNSRFPADSPMAAGEPRFVIGSIIVDHTAHHRGALSVYSRLLGKVPPMPYL